MGQKEKEAIIITYFQHEFEMVWKSSKKVKPGLWSANKVASPNSKHFNTLAIFQNLYVKYTFPNFITSV